MPYVFGCNACKTAVEVSSKYAEVRCAKCGGLMELKAELSNWDMKCSKCGERIKGGPDAEPRVGPCPFCDGGMMIPVWKGRS